MKFYITTEGTQKLKRSFLNLKLFSIINVDDILKKFNYNYETINDYESFIVSNKINDLILSYSKSKRIRGIIYSNPSVNEYTIMSLYDTLDKLDTVTNLVLLDDYNVPKHIKLYPYFDEIIYFPSIKKIRLIESKPITEMSKWKLEK